VLIETIFPEFWYQKDKITIIVIPFHSIDKNSQNRSYAIVDFLNLINDMKNGGKLNLFLLKCAKVLILLRYQFPVSGFSTIYT